MGGSRAGLRNQPRFSAPGGRRRGWKGEVKPERQVRGEGEPAARVPWARGGLGEGETPLHCAQRPGPTQPASPAGWRQALGPCPRRVGAGAEPNLDQYSRGRSVSPAAG